MEVLKKYAITFLFTVASLYWVYMNNVNMLDETLAFDSLWYFPGVMLPFIITAYLFSQRTFHAARYLVGSAIYISLSWLIYYTSVWMLGWSEDYNFQFLPPFFGATGFILLTKVAMRRSVHVIYVIAGGVLATLGFMVGEILLEKTYTGCILWTISVGWILNLAFMHPSKPKVLQTGT